MFFRRTPKEVKAKDLYSFISARREKYRVCEMCHVLEVSESGYYRQLKSTKRNECKSILSAKIQEILNEYSDNDNYGVRRVYLALLQKGVRTSYSTVRRIMKENGWNHKRKHHPNGITKEDREAQKAENILNRDFHSDRPFCKWLTDITEIKCLNGKLYLAAVLDCYNGEIVGFAMASHMRAELCVQAFQNACNRHGVRGMLVHSDRGTQFTSREYREVLRRYGATQSMSGTGKCYDNARMESFFATLKKEKIYRINTEKLTQRQVESIIFRYIEVYYNRQRVCLTNAMGWPPIVYRNKMKRAAA